MEAPQAQGQLSPDAAGTLVQDIQCRRCGYNLRGLNQAGRCPECGAPVGLSCQGDLLRFADPAWLEKLARGARLVLWGVLVSILASTTCCGLKLSALKVVAAAISLYGAWLLTAPDPSGIGEDRYVSDRKAVRFGLATGTASQLLDFLGPSLAGVLAIVLSILVAVAQLVGIVGVFATLTYFNKLATRIPDLALSRRARSLRWAMAITLGVFVVSGALGTVLAMSALPSGSGPPSSSQSTQFTFTAFGRSGPMPGGAMAPFCVAALAVFACLVVGLFVLILTHRLSKAFRAQAAFARATWAAALPEAKASLGEASGPNPPATFA